MSAPNQPWLSGTPGEQIARVSTWIEHLTNRIDPAWRPGEWSARDWLFVGNPDEPNTRIYRCSTPGCRLLTDVRNDGRCASCSLFLRNNQRNFDLLALDIVRRAEKSDPRMQKQKGVRPDDCKVFRDDHHCEREARIHGLCASHYVSWHRKYRPKAISVTAIVESSVLEPLEAFPPCIVPFCGRQQASSSSLLCYSHQNWYKTRNNESMSETDFAAKVPAVRVLGTFSLAPLPEPLRFELLFALQVEDRAGYGINPRLVTWLGPHLARAGKSFLDPGFLKRSLSTLSPTRQTAPIAFVRRIAAWVDYTDSDFRNVDLTRGDTWDTFQIGLQSVKHQNGRRNGGNEAKFSTQRRTADFRPIRQLWLRELVKQWARDMRPSTDDLFVCIRAFTVVSRAISLRADGDDPTKAKSRDIQKAIELLNTLKQDNGEPYSGTQRSRYLTAIRRALHYLRDADLMESIPLGFTVTPDHEVARAQPADDEPGKALPYRVVAELSRALDSLPESRGQTGSLISGPALTQLHRAALRALIDTGRRPGEVCSLKVGCVSRSVPFGGDGTIIDYTLTYDNHKAGRAGRTIPITRETGEALLGWEQVRKSLALPSSFDKWLFPSPSAGRIDADRHLTPGGLSRATDRLVSCAQRLEDDVPDRAGGGYLAFAGKIEPYSFRHSYAQRHADAGVDPDTLRELMDHKSISTTMGYYVVSAKRKRAAIAKLSPMSVDWHGKPAPMVSTSSYEVGSVAVPWGNCTDPSNVKAGGHACPIRFRCSGCSMYRPDPSFLPGIYEHVTQLRATLSMIEIAGTAAPWVLQSMREEIDSYDEIVRAMKVRLADLGEAERDAVDEASAALRKVRVQRPMIPLTVLPRRDA